MADRINPNRKNRLSPKDVLKRSAALTLLLSTVACRLEDFKDLVPAAVIISLIVLFNTPSLISYFFFGGREEFLKRRKEIDAAESDSHHSSYGGGRNYPDQ